MAISRDLHSTVVLNLVRGSLLPCRFSLFRQRLGECNSDHKSKSSEETGAVRLIKPTKRAHENTKYMQWGSVHKGNPIQEVLDYCNLLLSIASQ